MNEEKLSWLDYVIMSIVFALVCVSLWYLFHIDTKKPIDKSLIKKVDSHEIRLNRIDTLHLKYINEY